MTSVDLPLCTVQARLQ